ncbi:MAG: glycosyltransferase [Bacteroidales bacterium]|nr:glycosyltransferase [Bacteroidales bacterium]
MKILYVGGFDLPCGNAAAQRVVANSKLFVSLGHEVRLCGLNKEQKVASAPFEYDGLWCKNYPYPSNSIALFKHLCVFYQKCEISESWCPDIIIAYNFPAIALYRLYRYAKKRNIKVVSDCTEWYQGRGNFFFNIIKNSDTSLRMKVVQKKLDGLIVISKYLQNYYHDHDHVLLLPPLVDKMNPKWDIAKSNKSDSDKIKMLYAGNTSRKDRLDLIVKALEAAISGDDRKIEFDIIGMDEDRFKLVYPDTIIPSFVHFFGRIPHQEVLNMLSNHDYQVFVREKSRANMAGFPTKFVESISSGTLVLTNLTSDLSDYLHDGVNGFTLDFTSMDTLVSSLKTILSRPKSEIDHMRQTIDTEMFDYRRYSDQTSCFIDSL